INGVVDVVGLAAVFKPDIDGPVNRYVVCSHGDGDSCRSDGLIGFMAGQHRIPYGNVGAVAEIKKTAVRRAVITLPGNAMFQSLQRYVGAPDADSAGVIVVFGLFLVGDGSKCSSLYCRSEEHTSELQSR